MGVKGLERTRVLLTRPGTPGHLDEGHDHTGEIEVHPLHIGLHRGETAEGDEEREKDSEQLQPALQRTRNKNVI